MGSTSTTQPSQRLDTALSGVPNKYRSRIVKAYLELKRRFAEAQYDAEWDTSGLSAGKFCESVLRLLQNELTGSATPFGTHISNFPQECSKLIGLPKSVGLETLRVIVPRALIFLYTLRGKRGIGHVGGDVEANAIDAATVVRLSDWIVCELIRNYHKLSIEEAQSVVDAIAARNLPDIWSVAGKKRVLRQGLTFAQKTLLLVYSEPQEGVLSEDLFAWTEHSNFSVFKSTVLRSLHKKRVLEYDRETEIVYISPLGIKEVETKILPGSKRDGAI